MNAPSNDEAAETRMRDLLAAVKRARGINDPHKRNQAITAVGEATGAFLEDIGVTALLREQMVEHAIGELGARGEFAGKTFEELTRSEMLRTRGGLAVIRDLAARGVMTLFGLMGAKLSAVAVHDLRGHGKGREGLFAFTPKGGVSPGSGPAHALQEETVSRLGYTIGSTGGLLKRAMLERAAAYYNGRAQARGIEPVRAAAVRDWTQRGHASLYQTAVTEAATDRAARKIDISRGL